MDKDIKEGLIFEALNLIDLGSCDKRKCQEEERKRVQERLLTKRVPKDRKEEETALANYLEQLAIHEKKHMKGFKLIYPNGNEEKYSKYFEQSASLFGETTASRARQECARNQRVEMEAKLKQQDEFRQGPVKKPPAPKAPKPESPGHEKIDTKTKPLFTLYDKYKKTPAPSASSQPPTLPECEQNSSRPLSIADEEEIERLSLMLQRDNLVRSTGIAEQLYSLLDGVNSPPTNQRPPPPTQPLPINRPLLYLAQNHQYTPKMLPNIYTMDQDMARISCLISREKPAVDSFPKLNKKRPSNYRVGCEISQNFLPDNSIDYRSNSAGRNNSFGMWPAKSQSDQNMCARMVKQDFILTPHLVNSGNTNTYETTVLSIMGTGGKGSSSSPLQLVSQSASLSYRPDLSLIGRKASIPIENVKMNRTQRIREATNSIKVKQLVLQSQSQSNLILP